MNFLDINNRTINAYTNVVEYFEEKRPFDIQSRIFADNIKIGDLRFSRR
jgi:hypothetical protein